MVRVGFDAQEGAILSILDSCQMPYLAGFGEERNPLAEWFDQGNAMRTYQGEIYSMERMYLGPLYLFCLIPELCPWLAWLGSRYAQATRFLLYQLVARDHSSLERLTGRAILLGYTGEGAEGFRSMLNMLGP